jgi:hypothetical protein
MYSLSLSVSFAARMFTESLPSNDDLYLLINKRPICYNIVKYPMKDEIAEPENTPVARQLLGKYVSLQQICICNSKRTAGRGVFCVVRPNAVYREPKTITI